LFDKHNAAAKAAMELNDAICQLPPSAMKPAGVQKHKKRPLKEE